MSRALIVGASGFVGAYLARHLQTLGYEVYGTTCHGRGSDLYKSLPLDIRDERGVQALFDSVAPDEIYHLAGLSRPSLGLVSEFYEVNLHGTLNVLKAAQAVGAKILLTSSAYVYGYQSVPLHEELPLKPVNHYGVSKAAADLAALPYALEGLHVVRVRPSNHSGPGQSDDFVLASLVQQIAKIEAGQLEPVLKLGNMQAVRDFSDVRDIVVSYHRLLQLAQPGSVYNLGSGEGISIGSMAQKLLSLARFPIDLEVEATRLRATDIPYLVIDNRRVKDIGAWQPRYGLEAMLEDMLCAEREKLLVR